MCFIIYSMAHQIIIIHCYIWYFRIHSKAHGYIQIWFNSYTKVERQVNSVHWLTSGTRQVKVKRYHKTPHFLSLQQVNLRLDLRLQNILWRVVKFSNMLLRPTSTAVKRITTNASALYHIYTACLDIALFYFYISFCLSPFVFCVLL